MTTVSSPATSAARTPSHHRKPRSDADLCPDTRTPTTPILAAAVGVFIVSAAYTAGRLGYSGTRWADWLYWLGQLLIFIPIGVRLLSRRHLSDSATAGLALVLTVAEYLVNVCYSPAGFTFPDELWHWRSTVDMLGSGKLFTVNYALPISPRYPGLEELTSCFAQITRIPLFLSGLVVVGVAHLIFIVMLFMLMRAITKSYRLAGIAILIYSSTPDLSSFDSMYVYQTLAVAFMALALLAAWRASEGRTARPTCITALMSISATIVTHHATSYFLAVALLLLAITAAVMRRWRSAATLAVLSAFAVIGIICWIHFVAPATIGYFMPTIRAVWHGFADVAAYGHSNSASTGPPTPRGNEIIQVTSVLVISVLIPLGWVRIFKHYRRQPWAATAAVASMSWYLIVGIRFFVADGSELASRSSTFIYVPISLVAALALTGPRVIKTSLRTAAAAITTVIAVLTLVLDGFVNGWPAYWERLPGGYQVGGFERSVTPEGIATARWALEVLGPGNRFAADTGNYPMIASYGYQNPIRNVSYLYTSADFTQHDEAEMRAQAINYLLVDQRLSKSLPISGSYFPIDPSAGSYKHPLPLTDLTKFNRVPSIARIYDSGNIIIYDVRGF